MVFQARLIISVRFLTTLFNYLNKQGKMMPMVNSVNLAHNEPNYTTLQKEVSQIRTLKILTLIEHLKVFCLHTNSVPDLNTI